jgi:hypothetical protein
MFCVWFDLVNAVGITVATEQRGEDNKLTIGESSANPNCGFALAGKSDT